MLGLHSRDSLGRCRQGAQQQPLSTCNHALLLGDTLQDAEAPSSPLSLRQRYSIEKVVPEEQAGVLARAGDALAKGLPGPDPTTHAAARAVVPGVGLQARSVCYVMRCAAQITQDGPSCALLAT